MGTRFVSMAVLRVFLSVVTAPERGAFAERYLARLDQELNLTDAQQTQIGEAIEDLGRKVADTGAEGPVARLQMMQKAQSWQREFEAKVEASLTEQQKPVYTAHHEIWRQETVRSVMLDRMKGSLALTDEQVTLVDPIIAKAQQKAQALRDQNPGFGSLRQMKAVREDLEREIDAVLTEDQRAKYAELRRARESKSPGSLMGLLEE